MVPFQQCVNLGIVVFRAVVGAGEDDKEYVIFSTEGREISTQ
jgi:hypothetical protein